MISIIIPSFNHASTIGKCLESILSQTISDLEIIVVNDGSTDNTIEVLKSYADHIQLIDQPNQGAAAARNHGFDQSTGEHVMFCDADVMMRPEMLQKMLSALTVHPGAAYAYSSFRFGWKKFSSYPFSAERLRQMNFITTTSLIRRADFPRFDESLRRFQDWDLWLTILERGKGGVLVDEELFRIENPLHRHHLISLFGQRPSQWRPSLMHRIPWDRIGWIPTSIKKYRAAREIIKRKHNL